MALESTLVGEAVLVSVLPEGDVVWNPTAVGAVLVRSPAVLLVAEDRVKVVPADSGMVELSECTDCAAEEALAAAAEDSEAEIEDSTDACDEEMDDKADTMDDVKEAGGEVTGTGITTLPDVEAVKAVTVGTLVAVGAVPAADTSVLVAAKLVTEDVPVPVGRGKITSVLDVGAAVVLSSAVDEAAPVVVADEVPEEAAAETSDADAPESMLEKSDARDAETAVSVAVAATLESCELSDDAMLERALETSSVEVAVAPSELV